MKILSIPYLSEASTVNFQRPEDGYIEYRLDYSERWFEAEKHLDFSQNTIVTIRDVREGGIESIPLDKKIEYYAHVIEKYGVLVDLELCNYLSGGQTLPPDKLILSKHIESKSTNSIAEIEKAIEQGNQFKTAYLKVVAPINTFAELTEVEQLITTSKNRMIFVGVGKLGKLTRMLWRRLGSEAVYLGLEGSKTSGAQLTPEEDKLYDREMFDDETLIGGLIGGEQVYSSIGLEYYNKMFISNGLNSVYLPFVVDDLDDFFEWAQNFSQRNRFYGFSVTMPHKKSIVSKYNRSRDEVCNLVIPNVDDLSESLPFGAEPLFYNTDKDGFNHSFQELQLKLSEKILIVGGGGVAETALQSLKRFQNVVVSSRNTQTGSPLVKEYDREFTHLSELTSNSYDLVINCTPLGMKGEDFFEEIGLGIPTKFLDLVYCKEGETSAVRKCRQSGVKCVDGKAFWKYQAERQEQLFLHTINELKNRI